MNNLLKKLLILLPLICIAIGGWYFFAHRTKSPTIDLKKLENAENLIPVAIIGSGPAGLSAALYIARANIHTVVFDGKKAGGQLMGTSDVENWPGVGKKTGPDIIKGLREQAATFGATYAPHTIQQVDFSTWPFKLMSDDETTYHALAVIIATGADPKTLAVPGEKEYWGKGVTTCAICDAPFYKDKDVVVIGGGDSAAEEALQLASNAKNITILVRGDKMRASAAMQERLKAYSHIKIQYHTHITAITGDDHHVTGVTVSRQGTEEKMAIDGVFLAIGHIPNTQMFKKWLSCDAQGYLLVGPHTQKSSMAGVFGAGDVADHRYRQAGVAAGDGIKAALDATNFLVDHGYNDLLETRLESQFYDPREEKTLELTSLTSKAQFEKGVLESPVPVIVDFYTPQCPSCLAMMPTVAAVAGTFEHNLRFFKVDGAALPELMKQYDITGVPCFLAFKEGIVIGRATTIMTKRELKDFAQKLL